MRINSAAVTHWVDGPEYRILVVDNFYENVDQVRAQALGADYRIGYSSYPGLHCPLPRDEADSFSSDIRDHLNLWGVDVPEDAPCEIDFAVVTVTGSALHSRQAVPHIDNVPIFGLVHLSSKSDSFTCFYRHLPSGRVMLSTHEERAEFAKVHRSRRNHIVRGYIVDSSEWAEVCRVQGVYNRFVCYPGSAFHSVIPGEIPSPFSVAAARITQRIAFGQGKVNQGSGEVT
ncbi:DUF6445 family protein [Sphingomonas sp. WG]|uniref:DUF6445 family protein n=1 Tax=unclassified Sphingomonas TaxID=196159 RepID=UPI003FA71705